MPTQTPSTPSSLDPQIVNLAKAIRQTESNGDFSAKGASGEYGAYQFMPDTWNATAPKYGVNVPLQQATPEQQNEVAVKQLTEWKQEHPDWNVGNYASAWNAGPGKPDAYLGGNAGTNAEGVSYDTGAYAKKVATAYQQFKGQTNSPASSLTPPTAPGEAQTQQPSQSTFGGALQPPTPPQASIQAPTSNTQPQETVTGDIASGNYGGAALTAGKGLLNAVVGAPANLGTHLAELTGSATDALGLTTGERAKLDNKLVAGGNKNFLGGNDPTLQNGVAGAKQIAGDALQTGLLAAGPEAGAAKSVLGRLGANAALGAGFGIGGALSDGGNWQDVLKNAGIGAATGGVIGGAGELLTKAAQYLPQRLARTFIPGLNPETAQYAVSRGLGAPTKMLADSDANLQKVGSALGNAIKQATGPSGEAQMIPGQQIFEKVASQFGDAGMTGQDVVDNLKKLVPLKKDLIDRIASGSGTLEDLQRLNSAIGKATFKSVFDDPTVKAGKQVGSAVYHSFGNIIKTAAPDAAPLFDEYSKELQLNGALTKAIRRGEKARPFTLKDIVALFAGLPAGPLGALGALGFEKAATSPTINLKTAGLIGKLASPTVQALGAQAKSPLIGGTTSLLQRLSQGQ